MYVCIIFQSIWNQYFGDQELFSVIKQDVVRTFPGVDFFRKPIIQEAMVKFLKKMNNFRIFNSLIIILDKYFILLRSRTSLYVL